MSKMSKKKAKVPKITEEQYAEYISSLKTLTEPKERPVGPDKNVVPHNWNLKSE